MFVNQIRFFITISSHIQFGTTEFITDSKTSKLIQSVVNMNRVYKKIGFHISMLYVDGHFDTSRIQGAAAELNVTLNPVSEDEHITEAERFPRTINERIRCVQTTLLFKKMLVRITM